MPIARGKLPEILHIDSLTVQCLLFPISTVDLILSIDDVCFVLPYLTDILYPQARPGVLTYNPQLTHFDLTKNALAEFKERDKIPIFTEDKCWKFNANIYTDKKSPLLVFTIIHII